MSGERRRAIEARVAAAAARLEKEGRYTATRRCIQHGKVSVYAHCVSVADTACILAETLHVHVNERALIRGALLHDYFLYDWHDKANGHHWHGFTHPGTALHNARLEADPGGAGDHQKAHVPLNPHPTHLP